MNITILVVDDEEDTNLLFEQNFRNEIKSGAIKMLYADSAEKALGILKKNRPKINIMVILSDINMCGMTGTELLKIVSKSYPTISIFMLTTYGDIETTLQAWEFGAEGIVSKPINFNYLKTMITDPNLMFRLKEKGDAHD